MGPSIVYSERSNEELEALFRTIIDDDEFLNVCQEKFEKLNLPREKFAYDEISNHEKDPIQGRVVHEINMSIYYNVEVDRNNSDVTYVQRTINVVPDHKSKKNRFSNLNLSNQIDRLVKMHDYVRQSKPERKPSIKRRSTQLESKRRTTIATINESEEYDSAFLAQLVEQQLEAARRAEQAKHFTRIRQPPPPPPPVVNRAKFVQPPTFPSKIDPRHRVDHIEYPKGNLSRRPLTFLDNQPIDEREKLLRLGQQGILLTAAALGSQKIPDNIKTIELLEIPTHQQQDFRFIGYETLDDSSLSHNPLLRRAKSTRQINKQSESVSRRASTIITDLDAEKSSTFVSPLKSLKRHHRHKNETANHNKPVSHEQKSGKRIRRCILTNDDYCCCC